MNRDESHILIPSEYEKERIEEGYPMPILFIGGGIWSLDHKHCYMNAETLQNVIFRFRTEKPYQPIGKGTVTFIMNAPGRTKEEAEEYIAEHKRKLANRKNLSEERDDE